MNREQTKARLLIILTRHVGEEKAIGMGELYSRVFGKPWSHRINDTKILRDLITELRFDGALIGESRSKTGGGYYQARSAHELGVWFRRREREWKKKAYMLARMKRLSLDEYLGQTILNLQGDGKGQLQLNGEKTETRGQRPNDRDGRADQA